MGRKGRKIRESETRRRGDTFNCRLQIANCRLKIRKRNKLTSDGVTREKEIKREENQE